MGPIETTQVTKTMRFTRRIKSTNHRYRNRVPIDPEKLAKYNKGDGIDLKSGSSKIRNKIIKQKLKKKEKNFEITVKDTARTELLLTEDYGCLEADAGQVTVQYNQKQIADNVDITSAAKHFTLNLDFGPYYIKYTRNGRHLVLGGKKGHVAALDWITKKLACEINVMESVHDLSWLHIETMFAVAQKEWVFIYDNQGIELHCLKLMNKVNKLEFLPYHFLLASGSRDGYLAWLDISIGKFINSFNSRLGKIAVMTQNPSNALLCVGDSKGVVSMWSPNSKDPLVKMLCHTQAVAACAVHPYGTYMATSCQDKFVKIWDIRQLAGPLHNYRVRTPVQHLSYSQCGQLALAMGNVVEVYRSLANEIKPYLRHRAEWTVTSMQFCPYEDILGIGTLRGISSLLVPGSGEANFDALENNPFQTKTQRREAEVKALLDKIQPELICLDPVAITEVDVPTLKDKIEAKKNLLYLKPKEIDFKPRRTKAKGRGGTAKVIKTKKILKDLNRRETINIVRQANIQSNIKKVEKPQKDYGILNRFLPRSNKQTNR
ncbi:WD repeat-containing protein 46 [Apis mellifera]|uniref:WD repeat-containing protein 46 n=1 Tax=Apis mellifera TaxID=7460 RepID=A0A7M7LLZ8_APIME|nr:WD repeat-containing protein 46 [Apis mellifera]XP_026295585.1 WD repeat-containing protein 46 [Apis mellifera]|eukprot:XP_006558457.2 WD repeat-containing protein 46 [Apis mellifera]